MAGDAIPGAVAQDQSYALFNPLDIYQTEYYQKLFKKVPRANALSWMRAIKGRMSKRKTTRFTYGFYEEGQYMEAACTIGSITTSGSDFIITLSAGDHTLMGSTSTSFPIVGQSVLFADGQTVGYVIAKSEATPGAHTVTVRKNDSSQDIGTVGVAGTTIVFYSNAQAERSKQTQSRVPQFSRLNNVMHTFREHFAVTDYEMQNAAWFPYKGKKYLWYKGIDETVERFELQRELGHLITPQSINLTNAAGAPVQTAAALLPQIAAGGQTLEYWGKPDMGGFDEVMLTLDNNFGDKDYYCGNGHNLMLALKDFLKEFAGNANGNINFSSFDGGAEQAIAIGFKSYSVGAYSFHFNQWDVFSHKDTLGAPGLPFRHYGVFIPTGMAKNPNPDGVGQGGANNWENDYEPYIQMVTPIWGGTMNSNIYHDDYFMWETGAFGANGPTSDEAVKDVHFLGYSSLEMRNRNKFVLWKKANY